MRSNSSSRKYEVEPEPTPEKYEIEPVGPEIAAILEKETEPDPGTVQDPSNLDASSVCPITGLTFLDPVILADGHSYERCAAERWLADQMTSPVTGGAANLKGAKRPSWSDNSDPLSVGCVHNPL
jgi:hypothetical protein